MRVVASPRRGLALIELLIGLVLAVAVAGTAQALLLGSLRGARAQAERVNLQDNLRTAALILAHELQPLGFDSVPGALAASDILEAEPGRIRYRGIRGTGFTCLPPLPGLVLLRASSWTGVRPPAAGVDSVALFVEGDPAAAEDDAWVRAKVMGVGGGACADGAPALALATAWENPAQGADATARMEVGGPAKIFEILELQLYPQDGRHWLGMRSLSRGEVVQPLLGPLAGLTLEYLDRSDVPTAEPARVRTVRASLRAVTGGPGLAPDSLVLFARIGLRNMLRP